MDDNKQYEDLVEVKLQLARMESKLDDIKEIKDSLKDTSLRLERHSEKLDKSYTMGLQNKDQIEELKSKYDWLSKTVVGAIITSVVAVVFKFFIGI